MPRKVRGRPVAFGAAQLRALDKFLRGEYLMSLSGDPFAILEGEPFWEGGNAYFDASAFHLAFTSKTNCAVSAWQTTNALTQIGVGSVQRRFEDGKRMRIRTAPIPDGAECGTSPQIIADYWNERGPYWVGSTTGEDFLEFKREYALHGRSRAAMRFLEGVFAEYPKDKGSRLLKVLDSWDADGMVAEFNTALEVEPHAGGFKVQYRLDTAFGVNLVHGFFKWSEHSLIDYDAELQAEAAGLLEHTPDSTPEGAKRAVPLAVMV